MSLEARLLREAAYNLSGTDPQETQALLQMAAAKIDELHTLLAERGAKLAALEKQEPVAVVGSGYALYWQGSEPLSKLLERFDTVKVGSFLYAAAGAAPNAWKDAILDVMTIYGMDAPTTDAPEKILKDLIELATKVATDSTIAAGAVRSIPKGIRRELLDELGAELECADGDEWDDAVVTMVENYLAAGAAPAPEGWRSAVAMAYGHLWHVNNEPLTEAEIIKIAQDNLAADPGRDGYILPIKFARAIEAAHGIKS